MPHSMTRYFISLLCAGVLALGITPVEAQEGLGSEVSFERARELAFSGRREEAKAMSRTILEDRPDYVDVRLLLARLHAWDDEFEEARRHLAIILEGRPDYADAHRALVDVEVWTDHDEAALAQVDRGLEHSPGHPGLLLKKADVLRSMGRYDEANVIVNQVLERTPDDQDALQLQRRIQDRPLEDRMKLTYDFDRYNSFSDDWHEVSYSVTRRGDAGSLSLRVNVADRFGRTGNQFEVDAYPSLIDGVYAYLNLGGSGTSFFPWLRWGGEVHVSLPLSFEISGGLRQLHFTNSDVRLYTGSLVKYLGRFWFEGRVFYKESSESYSYKLRSRYYFGGRYNYVGVSAGFGSTPEVDDFTEIEIARLDSYSIGAELELPINRRFGITATAGYEEEELAIGRFRYHSEVGVGVAVFF